MKLLEKCELTNEMISKFSEYRKLLLDWNKKFNLTAIIDEDEIEEKHFVDSLYLDKFVDLDNKTLLDVGSGAGFPGIPLAIVHPSLKVTLLESNHKKIVFLNEVVKALKLNNVNVVQYRAEEFSKKECYDFVCARAVKELNILLEICFHLVKINGFFIAYKSSNVDKELSNAKHCLNCLEIRHINRYDYKLPKSQDSRVLLVILKEKRTKNKYPRPYTTIVKSPL